jgi:hypothetical protein
VKIITFDLCRYLSKLKYLSKILAIPQIFDDDGIIFDLIVLIFKIEKNFGISKLSAWT